MNEQGGLDWCVDALRRSADILYGWAEASATPPRSSPTRRSGRPSSAPSTSTGVDAARCPRCCGPTASSTPSSYRKLGRNQLRIGMFPAVEPDDVAALTRCIDHVVDRLS